MGQDKGKVRFSSYFSHFNNNMAGERVAVLAPEFLHAAPAPTLVLPKKAF